MIIYTLDSRNRTRRDAADHFAECYFIEPRAVDKMVENKFILVGGTCEYEIRVNPNNHWYEIHRLNNLPR